MSSTAGKARLLTAFAVLLTAAIAEADGKVNSEAIAKVTAGEIQEAKASWWGFDPADATAALQSAIDSGARRVVVEDMGKPWIVTPIQAAGDQEIFFEQGVVVEAKRGQFRGRNDSLFNIIRKKNVALVGDGAVLRMHRQDYDGPDYTKAEWRHVVNIKSSTNVRIVGLTLAESGGDGIYLGTAERGVTNKDVHIKDVICDGNYRQGISVITAENLLIENTVMKNTGGTAPEAGIDFEPNSPDERLVNCVMRDCVSENNRGCGYVFYLPNLNARSAPISIRFENCTARGTNRVPFVFTAGADGPAAGVRGKAQFVGCTFADGGGPAITISRKPASACRLKFADCRLVNPAAGKPDVPAIEFSTRQGNTEDVGGVAFVNCILEDTSERPIARYSDREGGLRLVDVTGALRIRRGGDESVHVFDQAWLDGLHVGNVTRRFPEYETDGVRFEPAGSWPQGDVRLPPMRLRRTGTFVLYADKGDAVRFSLRQLQVGRYSGRDMPVVAIAPSGKKRRLGEVPFPKEETFEFEADETGVYRIPFDCGANKVEMASANCPACVSGEAGRIALIGTTGDFYFHVPAGTREFGLKISGEGDAEAVAATIYDPAGDKVWERPRITAAEQFVAKPDPSETAKTWRVTFARPAGATMEDFYVQLQNVPPFLAATPGGVLRPVR